MRLEDIPVPEVYKESSDFRFFIDWFTKCLSKIQYDIENTIDLYDPQRCPSNLLWLLADTMGYKYDSRLCTSFNRLVLLYFMSMIYNRGSKTGMTIAAEVNLAQFNINEYGKEDEILYDRLEDTNIPVNSVYVTPHVREGYIDVVYASTQKPINACLEYVRPLGMYVFEHAGVTFDARTKISVDARLANARDFGISIGPTHVGHYRRSDYASIQRMEDEKKHIINSDAKRNPVWYRNSESEGKTDNRINPGYRTLYSLQLSNNEHVVNSLLQDPETKQPIFSIGYDPQNVNVDIPPNYLSASYLNSAEYRQSKDYRRPYNLRYNRATEENISSDVYTLDGDRTEDVMNPRPAVNPVMASIGDAIHLGADNRYAHVKDNGSIEIVDKDENSTK